MSQSVDQEPDLPEGVINANPAGGWDRPDGRQSDQAGDTLARGNPTAEPPVEGDLAGQGADPDLVTDEQAEREETTEDV